MTGKHRNYIELKLCFAVIGMFCFGFALVPLYDVFCKVTGINGKTENTAYEGKVTQVDTSREIRVQFIARKNDGSNWDFYPVEKVLTVHPGESVLTWFYARNPNSSNQISRAIPSVSPGRAASYFHKTACFCFERQPLDGLAETKMPLVFVIDHDLPKSIRTITLAYTLFDVTDDQQVTMVTN